MRKARLEEKGRTRYVDAFQVSSPREAKKLSDEKKFRCPACGKPVHFKGKVGGTYAWHFAHYQDDSCDLRDSGQDPDYPESAEHRVCKQTLQNWLTEQFPAGRVRLEEKIETQIGEQYADVWLGPKNRSCQNAPQLAFEVQKSRLKPKEWRSRHEGYRSKGIHDEWILIGDEFDIVEPKDSETNAFELGGLPRTIVEETGRLLWIDNDFVQKANQSDEAEQPPPKAAEAQVWALEPIAGHYAAVRGHPFFRTLSLLDKNPNREKLLGRKRWKDKIQGQSLVVEPENAERHPLDQFRVKEENPFVVLESPFVPASDVYEAWLWEKTSRLWDNRKRGKLPLCLSVV
jgi:hypothetical protein